MAVIKTPFGEAAFLCLQPGCAMVRSCSQTSGSPIPPALCHPAGAITDGAIRAVLSHVAEVATVLLSLAQRPRAMPNSPTAALSWSLPHPCPTPAPASPQMCLEGKTEAVVLLQARHPGGFIVWGRAVGSADLGGLWCPEVSAYAALGRKAEQ